MGILSLHSIRNMAPVIFLLGLAPIFTAGLAPHLTISNPPPLHAETGPALHNGGWQTSSDSASDSDSSLVLFLPLLQRDHPTRINRPPQVNAGSDRIIALPEGADQVSLTLDGSATDPDRLDRILTYHWSGIPDPDPNNIPNPQVRLGLGRHTFELKVFDPHQAMASDSVTIEVVEELPGVATGAEWRLWETSETSETLIATVTASPTYDHLAGLIGFFDGEPASLARAFVRLRFSPEGRIDAFDGHSDQYRALQRLEYRLGEVYGFRIVINIPSQTFDVWGTPAEGVPILIARDFAFSTGALPIRRVNHIGLVSTEGSFQAERFISQVQSDYQRVTPKTAYGWFPDRPAEEAIFNASPTPGEGWYGTPDIHPSGTDMIFSGAAWGLARIWRYTFETKEIEVLTPPDFVAAEPAYSADGSSIVFTSDKDLGLPRFDMFEVGRSLPQEDGFKGGYTSAANLYVMDADGQNLRQLTDAEGDIDKRGSFSPDGDTVVFLSSRGAQTLYMWTVPFDASSPPERVAMDDSPWAGRPRYSPDGEEIFFFSGITDGAYDPRGRHTLCSVPAEGGSWRILPNDSLGIGSHGPAPDPTGEHLWYHAYNNNLWGLYKLPLAGGAPKRVIPPGFAQFHIAHATEARNGAIAFDSRTYLELP